MKDKSKIVAIIVAIAAISVLIFTYFFDNKVNEDKKDIKIVTNYSNFYTVNSCLYRLIDYISSKDSDSLLLVLDQDYKLKNNINNNNVLSIFENIDENSTFVSRKMYYEQINKNIIKYYVYGYVEKNQLFDEDYINKLDHMDMYFIVYLDTVNKTFAIEPYSGEIFIGGELNEK